jgi:hypothetical protein
VCLRADRYLESKHCSFARYADDFVISVKSSSEGERIKAEVIDFLATLKLPINTEKSQVVSVRNLSFLGFIFKGKKIVWSPKALANFKHRISEIMGRKLGLSIQGTQTVYYWLDKLLWTERILSPCSRAGSLD